MATPRRLGQLAAPEDTAMDMTPTRDFLREKRYDSDDPSALIQTIFGISSKIQSQFEDGKTRGKRAPSTAQLDKSQADELYHCARQLQRILSHSDTVHRASTIAHLADINAKLDALAQDQAALRAEVKAAPAASYAAAASKGASVSTSPSSAPKRPYAPARDRSAEVLLRAPKKGWSDPPLAGLSAAQLVKHVNDALRKFPTLEGITARSVHRYARTGDLSITFTSRQDATSVICSTSGPDWVKAVDPSFRFIPPQFPVVTHGVPTSFDVKDGTGSMSWSQANPEFEPSSVDWIRRLPEGPDRPHHASARIVFTSPEDANRAIERGLAFEGHLCPTHKARLPPRKCTQCQRWGHSAPFCNRPRRCGICGDTSHFTEGHRTECGNYDDLHDCAASPDDCTVALPKKCATCNDPDHSTFDRICPETVKAEQAAKDDYLSSGVFYDVDSAPPHVPPNIASLYA